MGDTERETIVRNKRREGQMKRAEQEQGESLEELKESRMNSQQNDGGAEKR